MAVAAIVAAVALPPIGGDHRTALAQPAPPFTVLPTSLDFGPTQVFSRSAPQQLRLTNTGTTQLTFSIGRPQGFPVEITGCAAAVDPGQSCTADVVFAPPGPGDLLQGNLRVTAGGGEVQVPITLRFAPFSSPADPPTPIVVDFGSVPDGQTATRTLTVRNWWTGGAAITAVTFPPGSRYSVVSRCPATVLSGASCDLDITYSPGLHVGADDDVLTMSGPWGAGGAAASEVFPVRATGTASPIVSVSPTALHFPALQQVGTTSPLQDVVVTNSGTAPLALTLALGPGVQGEFAISGCNGATIAPGDHCTVSVAFAPQGVGITPRDGRLGVFDQQAPGVTTSVHLTTDYVLPLGFDPSSVTFPDTPLGATSAPVTIGVKSWNSIDTPIEKVVMLDPEDFTLVSTTCVQTLPSGQTCEIVAAFHPSATGENSGDLLVFFQFRGQRVQEVLTLRGTGLNRPPTAVDDSGSVRAGATLTIDPRRNDSDPDAGAVLGVPTIVTAPSVGTATVNADGTVTFTAPRRIASGTVITIVYSVCDQQGACSTGTIRITITAIGGLLPATGSQTALLAALAACFVGAGLLARRIGQGARVGRR